MTEASTTEQSAALNEPEYETGEHEAGHAGHPDEREYIKIALILAVITLAEVLVYYVESLEGLLVPILIVMSTGKFVLVVLWFMHLKFDNKLFRRFFVTGILLALFCYLIVLTTFHVFSG